MIDPTGLSPSELLTLLKNDVREWNDLRKAYLEWSPNLSEVDFGDADLFLVDLSEVILVKSDLSKVKNLTQSQLKGADLTCATLPDYLSFDKSLYTIADISKTARTIFLFMITACLLGFATITTVSCSSVIMNSDTSVVPMIGARFFTKEFLYFSPVLLIAFYTYFHLYLKDLWDEIARLPAVFPDGATVDQKTYPWLLNNLVIYWSPHLKNRPKSKVEKIQKFVTLFLAWWLPPMIILGIWIRSIVSHEPMLIFLIIAAFTFAFLEGDFFFNNFKNTICRREPIHIGNRFILLTVAMSVSLTIFSLYVIYGPKLAIDEYVEKHMFLVASKRLFYANFNDQDISTKPSNWLVIMDKINKFDYFGDDRLYYVELFDEILEPVRGADLRRMNLRFLRAEKVFLTKANLEEVDLYGAELPRASLFAANLSKANLQEANLWKAYLQAATLYQAKLDNANFYDANLQGATLQGSSMKGADLYKANLIGVNMVDIDLENGYLQEANLEKADLYNANLKGVNFLNARFNKTLLHGANMSGAENLTYSQLLNAVINEQTMLPSSLKAYKTELVKNSREKLKKSIRSMPQQQVWDTQQVQKLTRPEVQSFKPVIEEMAK